MEGVSNINLSEVDDTTIEKLKGDAIGDTLYSESFVLKTLLQLSDLNWSEEVEEDLCYLWDMTTETAVCKYLYDLSFPSLVCSALVKYDEGRFVEIIIGILANILCADCEKKIEIEDIQTILKELSTDDSLVLIQVNRFIIALAHMYQKLSFFTQEEMDKITFILNNSTNHELLLKTLEAVSKITEDLRISQELVNSKLYEGIIEGFETLSKNNLELENEECQVSLKFLLQSITNICVYINKSSDEDLLYKIQNCGKFEKILKKTVSYFSYRENLLPVTDNISFYFNAISYIFVSIEINFSNEIFVNLCKILYNLHDCRDELPDLFKDIVEILSFFVYSGEKDTILEEFKTLPYKKGILVLNSLKANEKKLDFKIGDQLKYLFKEYK